MKNKKEGINMRFTEDRLNFLMDLKPRLTPSARNALIDVCCHEENIDIAANNHDITRQGIAKNIRELEILDIKISNSYDSSLLLGEYGNRLCTLNICYIDAVKHLSIMCHTLGGDVERNTSSGEVIFKLDRMTFVTHLNRPDDPDRLWSIHSFLS